MKNTRANAKVRNDTVGLAVWASLVFLWSAGGWSQVPGVELQQTPPRCDLPAGFSIEQVADDRLATNIFCMTSTADGRIFVSGPGYVKELLDEDQDGAFERVRLIADFPATGAQGLLAEGNDLLVVGDDGLWRLSGALGGTATEKDNEARQAKRERLLEISTRGEHHAHALRRGPDGFLYLIAGNETDLDEAASSFAPGPLEKRRAGFIVRISPDFSTRQFVAHGFRNAYDFDFNSLGQLFTFDSDGERDISMPWYRPTRVFEILPGDDAGWVNKSWKRPSYYFDMPKTIGAAGRGSPTGVVCYGGAAFPQRFRDCVFAGDWTFGRIVACLRNPATDNYEAPIDFLSARDDFAFPVTDLVIDSDGTMLVSVGGRGTAGGVYRIRYDGDENKIDLNQPAGGFQRLAFRGNPDNRIQLASKAIAVLDAGAASVETGLPSARKADALAFFAAQPELAVPSLWARPLQIIPKLNGAAARGNWARKQLVQSDVVASGFASLDDRIRLAQLAVGGAGGTEGMFSGVTPVLPVDLPETGQQEFRVTITELMGQLNSTTTRQELARLITMLDAADQEITRRFVSEITEDSPVDDDIFWLSCIAMSDAKRDAPMNQSVASSLLRLNAKVVQQNRLTDLHWTPLLTELATRLLQKDADGKYAVADLLLAAELGEPERVFLFAAFPEDRKVALTDRVEVWVRKNPNRVTGEHVRVLADGVTLERAELLRSLSEKSVIRDDVILGLAPLLEPQDGALFVAGLESMNPTVVKEAAIALRKLRVDTNSAVPVADVSVAALNAALRLGNERQDVSVRDQLIMLLQTQTGQQFNYQFKQFEISQNSALQQWQAWLVSQWPDQAAAIGPAGGLPATAIQDLEQGIVNLVGDAERGRQVFEALQCGSCHGSRANIGPRLEGVTRRLNQHDLLVAIADPDRQVSDRYRATIIETGDGMLYRGTIVFESADGLTLREGSGRTIRLNEADIESRQLSRKSAMPGDLLGQATDQQVRDLLDYLMTL